MNIDENWQNFTEKKCIRFKSTKKSDSQSNKIQDVKSQFSFEKRRQKGQGNALSQFYERN